MEAVNITMIHGQRMYILGLKYAIEMADLGEFDEIDTLPYVKKRLAEEEAELKEM